LSRLAPVAKLLVLLPVPLWIVLFSFAVGLQIQGRGTALLGLSVEDSRSYPVLTGQVSAQYSSPLTTDVPPTARPWTKGIGVGPTPKRDALSPACRQGQARSREASKPRGKMVEAAGIEPGPERPKSPEDEDSDG
jgi:hypothetical protein